MNKYLKLAAFVVLGLAVSLVVYYLLVFGILEILRSRSGRSPESYLWVAFLVMLPFALLLGSILTGYLSSPEMNKSWRLIGITPGLYLAIGITIQNFIIAEFQFAVSMLLAGLFWFLVSLSGVGLGHLLRSRGIVDRLFRRFN